MTFSQPSTRTVTLIIVILAALTCTMFSLVCLGHDATVAALTVAVTAIVLSGIGIVLLTFFITDNKSSQPSQPQVILNTIRPHPLNQLHFTDRPPLPSYPPTFVPPFPLPPPQIIAADSTILLPPPPPMANPPSYDESSEIEDQRITNNSNAPPAYNATNFVSDNNIASFSPPPFYSPPIPFFGTSVQTSTMYLSAEDVARTPSPSSPIHRVQMRAPSPVRRHPARKPRRQSPRQPKPQNTVLVIEEENNGASTSEAVPKTPTRTPLPQMIIDCSKAEPTLFTINGEESII